MPQRKSSGFTLVELLVVIAIIGIIASLVFPAFSRARENTRRANCQSNLKQTALGLKMYTGDYDSNFPRQRFDSGALRGWADAIFPYTKSLQVLQCPSESTPPNPNPWEILSNPGYTDYAFNSNLSSRNEAILAAPVSTILIAEGASFSAEQPKDGDDDSSTTVGDCDGNSSRAGAIAGICQLLQPGQIMHADVTRHFSGGNYAFADGHVKWLLPIKIYNWCTAPDNNATFAFK